MDAVLEVLFATDATADLIAGFQETEQPALTELTAVLV